jgi:integrase
MSVKMRNGGLYLYFRPFKDKQIGLKVDVTTKTEAKRLEAILTRVCRTGNYAALDPTTQELCVRMFQNQSWELPPELGGGTVSQAPQKVLTLLDACKLFVQYPEIRVKSKKALDGYERALVNIGEILGLDTPFKDLWIPDLKEYQVKRLGKGAAPSTINTELSALSRVFAVMIEMQLVETNPVRLVKRLSTKSNEREVYLSRETVQAIAAKCPGWYQRIIWCAFYSGMRRGEILGLTRKQVNLSKRMIHLEPEGTKERRRKRVPIHFELVPILEAAMRTPFLTSDRLFLVQDSRGVRIPGTDSIDNPWPKACAALEEKELLQRPFPRFHDLRHTWRTNARRSGMDYQIAESIMGHWFKGKSVNDRYGHIDDYELIQAIDTTTFDHGETVILAPNKAEKKTESPKKECEHFVNMGRPKQKKTQVLS